MVDYLPFLIEIGMLVFCLIDCLQSDESTVRNLPKIWWIVLIVLLPIAGGIAWLVAGRPVHRADDRWSPTAPAGSEHAGGRGLAPDDDPEFLAGLRDSDAKHEQMLRDWEAQLRERERRLKNQDDDPAS